MNRVLTIQVEITDKDEASWIWRTHRDNQPFYGVHVHGIHEGTLSDQMGNRDIPYIGLQNKDEGDS